MKRLFTQLLACLAALGLSSAFAASYQQFDLFPLTLGSSWTYDDGGIALVSQATDNNGVLSVVITNGNTVPHGPGSLSLVADAAEVRVTGFGNPNYIIVDGDKGFSPFVMRPMSLGRSWTGSGYSNGYLVQTTVTVTDTNATVTIGRNTYRQCTEVTVSVTYPSGAPSNTGWVNNKHYFLPGVGCIKRVLTSDNGSTDITQAIAWNIEPWSTGPVAVVIAGQGTVSPKDGTLLEIGKLVSATATPGLGYVLTNWLVQVNGATVLSTNRAAPFLMQSNLVLTVTFADVAKPMLTITAPMANQRWSNAVFTVAGKATDNGPLAGVSYQLNGGAWATAQTANGWSNWTAGVTLTPGTNRVSAYAVDAAGNKSDTKTVSFTYVVTSPLVVQTIGAGTLSPNYSGQALEIGKTYSLSAKAAKGFTFRGWTGGVTSPLAKLTFVMQPGLTLTANFADTTKPTLKVLSPKTKAKLTGVLVTVTGTAADNGPLSAVNCQLNGGAWITANGTTSWQTGLHLVSGANTIKVYAVDAAGNVSTTNTLIVTCTATGARAASEWAAADAPVLSIRREGNEILLSWPAEVAGYSIESTETLDESAIWTPITNPPEVVEGQNTVTDNLGDKPKFYRLRK